MANTYTQIYIHLVFAVKYRRALILDSFREDLHKYIAGIIRNKNCRLYAINSVRDHIHILVSLHPAVSVSKLVQEIKNNSSRYINSQKWLRTKFQWQVGYGAFSHSQSSLGALIKYIKGQEEHHRKKSFREEYVGLLRKYGIEYDDAYLFDFF